MFFRPGTYTTSTQIAADTLQVPVTGVQFELGDSDYPKAEEHGGSTTTASIGPAVQKACTALIEKLRAKFNDKNATIRDATRLLRQAGLAELKADANVKPGEEKESMQSILSAPSSPRCM